MTNMKLATALLLISFVAPHPVVGDEVDVSSFNPSAQYIARLESLLTSLKQTQYQHTTEIDETDGSVQCDCSGLVGYMLRQTYPEAYVSLRGEEAPWRKRPLSVTYYESFVSAEENSGGYWQRVTKLTDAVPGDILAWRKTDVKAGSTTGHTCTIAGKPELVGDAMLRVRLIDSTRSPHENDSRSEGKNGMGAGFKTFLVDENGGCVGYLVGTRAVMSRIAIGRLVEPKETTSHAEDKDFVGLTTEAVAELANQRKRSWRIIRENGKPKPLRMAINDERLNFVIKNNQVIRVLRG
ncbi:hypothetical protein Poly51_23770 [Rubripirellula tenax]|uniref:Uncharacterized protein n=1 Tax=Rubripirellula tenax TaxID=2528015 RepID=A0A5C6F8M4_9BACT|nr:hypothetical protein [Rubripirellula tenax]TWU56466.1 hypothetical protein Poly51_23770 [Rubripirellula tenax]